MKRLKDCVSLYGKKEEITMMDLRKHPGEILTLVSLGKSYIITRSSSKIAFLNPIRKNLRRLK